MVITADALHTQHATATLLDEAGAGYVMTVKANQPSLLEAVCQRIGAAAAAPDKARDRGHGRTEERLLYLAPADGIVFPGAAQIFRIVRHVGGLDGQRTSKEIVHGITNLRPDQAGATELAALIRGHWSIENSIHYVRSLGVNTVWHDVACSPPQCLRASLLWGCRARRRTGWSPGVGVVWSLTVVSSVSAIDRERHVHDTSCARRSSMQAVDLHVRRAAWPVPDLTPRERARRHVR